ncbi:MAG TPA: hypothetical protein VGJ04_06205 [Pirellulales bacterium]|jgi:hypothetical protein
MPRFSLKALLLMVGLLAAGFAGLLFQFQSSSTNYYLLFGAWIIIGEAVLIPFWSPSWITFAGVAFGVWIGIVMCFIHIFLLFINSR